MSGAVPEPAVRLLEAGDAEAVAAVLADAFATDPVMSWTLGGGGRAYRLFLELARRIYLARGFGHIVGDDAATLWLPPGETAAPRLFDELGVAGAVLRAGGLKALMRGKTIGDIMAKHHPPRPHYYLFAVGVRDGRQGEGLGGRLIREGLARADTEGVGAYLENSNPRNTPLYQRLGFAATALLPLPAGAPPLLAMLREPAAG
ncbi:MAG: GNAT family N-acetyltransferase [Pseudomonadota bacterium]|nr:GNAT family N-acetyltransferase [Pseudomonadota bacterium]